MIHMQQKQNNNLAYIHPRFVDRFEMTLIADLLKRVSTKWIREKRVNERKSTDCTRI